MSSLPTYVAMFGKLLRRLIPESADPRTTDRPNSAQPAPPGAATEAGDQHPSVLPRLVEPELHEVTQWLELDIRQRIAAVHDTFSRADRDTDAPAFLDAMARSFEAVVRQPPLAAQRALSVSRDARASTARLVGLVETDPGLSQGLLRYANSAFYASAGGRCVSLMNAVQRVGTTGVHNVVLRSMVDGLLCRPGGSFQSHVDLTWEHMVRTAPIARSLAKACDVNPDEAYALGLLHDVGKLVIFDRLGELRRHLRREVRFPRPIMSVVLRFLHEPLGGLAAIQWGLGAGVAHSIATHHRSPVPEVFDRRCELIHIAEKVDLWRIGAIAPSPEPCLEDWWRDGALNIDRAAAAAVIRELPVEEEAGVAS